jgi:hypothetical protein
MPSSNSSNFTCGKSSSTSSHSSSSSPWFCNGCFLSVALKSAFSFCRYSSAILADSCPAFVFRSPATNLRSWPPTTAFPFSRASYKGDFFTSVICSSDSYFSSCPITSSSYIEINVISLLPCISWYFVAFLGLLQSHLGNPCNLYRFCLR